MEVDATEAQACTIRKYGTKAGDFQMVSDWRKAHDYPVIPETILPALGVVAESDGAARAAAWLYQDNSVGVCFLNWLVTAPGLSPAQARAALRTCIDFLTLRARELEYGFCIAYAAHPALIREARAFGFVEGARGVTELAKRID